MEYIRLFIQLWHYAKGHRHKVIAFIGFHTISMTAGLLMPLVFAQILNAIQVRPKEEILQYTVYWLLVWVGLFLTYNIMHRIGRYFEFNVAFYAKKKLQEKCYKIVTHLPLSYHTDNNSGAIINRINMASKALFDFSTSQYEHIAVMIDFFGSLIILSYFSHIVGAISIVFSVLLIWLLRRFDLALIRAWQGLNKKEHKIASVLFDFISNIKTIITLKLGTRTGKELSRAIDQTYKPLIYAEAWVSAWKWFTLAFLLMIFRASTVLIYVMQKISGGGLLLIGNVTAVFQYMDYLSQSFSDCTSRYQDIIEQHTSFEAVKDILKLKSDMQIAKFDQNNIDFENIRISDLSFAYDTTKTILSDIDLTFTKNEKIALIGESGSGKSSLLALLKGLYIPNSGILNLDNQIFEGLEPLFEQTTLIPQEPEIFENTILYNITVGIDYSDAEVALALKLSCFDKVIDNLPNGLMSDVREKGVTLSGGQRQRLSFARGLLAAENSRIILLDEPTSSVDSFNEAAIYEHILSYYKDRLVISSIHRLHLLNKFDRIIVMSKGRVVQNGNLNDLLAEGGLFKILWDKYQNI